MLTGHHGGNLLEGEDPDPIRHQVAGIQQITPLVIGHRLNPLVGKQLQEHQEG
jgi:hypothetical protein